MTSSITLIASRTVPSASRTGLALMRDQRVSCPPGSRNCTSIGSGSSPISACRPGSDIGESGSPSGVSISQRPMISVSGARSSASAEGKPSTRTAASLAYTSEPSGALGGDRVGDALEDRAQVVGDEPLAELGGAQLGHVLAGDERDAVDRLRAHPQRAHAARRVARHGGAAQALAAGGAHGGQVLLGERAAVGVAAALGREPGGGGAADGVVAAQLARGAVGGEHAAGAGLDGHDRGRDSVQHRIRPADLGSARRGR